MEKLDSRRGERDVFVELRHLAAEIPVGSTENRIRCPFCDGGRNRDRAFSITRVSESEARYCCHRATCGRAGRIAAWGFRLRAEDTTSGLVRSFSPRLYSGSTRELGEEWNSSLLCRFGISKEESNWAGWREDIETKRLVCPILSPNSIQRGVELRIPSTEMGSSYKGPKTSSHRNVDEVWMGWFRRTRTGPVLLVEDCISALKGSRHIQTASLLGSHLSLDHILETIEVAGNNPVFLALDKDATDKTLKFISEWRFIAPNFSPCPLSKDLKYMTDEEIKKVISK